MKRIKEELKRRDKEKKRKEKKWNFATNYTNITMVINFHLFTASV